MYQFIDLGNNLKIFNMFLSKNLMQYGDSMMISHFRL